MAAKFFPKIGDELYLQPNTGDYWADAVKRPYTVIDVRSNVVVVQACTCIFNGPQFFDSLPEKIIPNENGLVLELHWAPKKQVWQIDRFKTGYPDIAHFGKYEYFPYLN